MRPKHRRLETGHKCETNKWETSVKIMRPKHRRLDSGKWETSENYTGIDPRKHFKKRIAWQERETSLGDIPLKAGKGKQDLNSKSSYNSTASKAGKKMTRRQRQQERNQEQRQAWEPRRQRQPRAKSSRETSLGDQAAAAAKSEVMKGDKLEKQDGSGSQERNHEGRQA